MAFSFPPDQAWLPLPAAQWNAESARHLLRRAGWTALPEDVDRAVREGLDPTLDRLFPERPPYFAKPAAVARLQAEMPAMLRQIRQAKGMERRELQRNRLQHGRMALQNMSLEWLTYAATPANSAFAKWTLFLSDVYVVSAQKVQNPAMIYDHFDIIARHGFGRAPALTKAISRSPAMVIYLDLNQSKRQAPNENFAREMFELFVLGEGNYTEHDIKESARAFTGYRANFLTGEFHYYPRLHDPTEKTIFGETGRFTGDDVIDLAYRQPAAGAFVPHEMVKFYLSDTPLPPEYLAALGVEWRRTGYDLRWLAKRFFASQLFYAPEFRANFIKSPIQFVLGLHQDLRLDLPPLARMTINPMREMGQWLFFPPNVRGWVGGHRWIDSATITARRQVVELAFRPLPERILNADEVRDLDDARDNGLTNFSVTNEALAPLVRITPAQAAAKLTGEYLAPAVNDGYRAELAAFIAAAGRAPARHLQIVRRAAATVLQTPEYQLC